MLLRGLSVLLCVLAIVTQVGCQKTESTKADSSDEADISDHLQNEIDSSEKVYGALRCIKATAKQIFQINLGNEKKDELLQSCRNQTNGSNWCDQLVHPNLNSQATFRCTYGPDQIHQLIHPDESTWKYAIEAVKIVQDLASKYIRTCQIYNWWRPEPYNKNVGGAAGRHPYGTSIDVRFCSNEDANRAFNELCKMRRERRIRAIGHYGSASLHLGIGDRVANTWGKSCP